MSGVVCDDAAFAVLGQACVASRARAVTAKTGIVLSTNTNNVANLNAALGFGANSNCDANDFVSDNTRVLRSALKTTMSQYCRDGGNNDIIKMRPTHPDLRVCKSEPQIPECVTLISTSVSSQAFG